MEKIQISAKNVNLYYGAARVLKDVSADILEKNVMPEAQRLLGLRRPGRSLGHRGCVVVRGPAGWIRY